MKIIIAGGTGFLGEALTQYFESKGHIVAILTRNPQKENHIQWDAFSLGTWTNALEKSDVLINMVGKSVDCRYTKKNKDEILTSRINSTKILQEAVDNCVNPPKIWLNASSATIYIHAETQLMNEKEGIIGDDFSINICKEWEKAFFEKNNPKIRKVALRTSIVMGKNGGAYQKLALITKLGIGGKQGRGNQNVSWIHIQDFCEAVNFLILEKNISGPVNITAPNPLPNDKMMGILRERYNVIIGISSPVFLLELASVFLQTETELLLKSRNVFPEKLIKNGFAFIYNDFKSCVVGL